MPKLTDRIFGSHSENEIRKLEPIVKKVESLQETMAALTNEELSVKTDEFRDRIQGGETLDQILPEAFAAMREADKRVLGMEPFPVQILAGMIIHQGRVAECRTGEGKTLTATLPAYLNALTGKGVLVVTANDYLAGRDASEMGTAYRFMGLTTGVVINGMDTKERQEAYACDITYVTDSELGFDYLRDHTAKKPEGRVLRNLNYAIIDEADSILIDGAGTPLILSGDGGTDGEMLAYCDAFAKSLTRGADAMHYTKLDYISGEAGEEDGDYTVDEKGKSVSLTEAGARKAEIWFQVDCITDPENFAILHSIQNACKANAVMQSGKDYIVKDGEVQIVDEFTGRVLPGRRYSDGLHQAIEAKEGVKIQEETATLASITYQSFFRLFAKTAGMTGTGIPAEKEFREVYGMDVVQVPPNRPSIREDGEDEIYATMGEKDTAVLDLVKAAHEKGQPILLGTKTVEDSERYSDLFRKAGIPHTLLNARQDQAEAEAVAKAGQEGAVTIATNMAGRGTDIKLSDAAKKAGGLFVIGTERSGSRRIDDQLTGRSGRQGDPGRSRFILSMEDELIRLFAPKNQTGKIIAGTCALGEPLSHPLLSKAVANAQSNWESTQAAQRKRLLDYDEIVSGQRDQVYAVHDQILSGENLSKPIAAMIRECAEQTVRRMAVPGDDGELSVTETEVLEAFSYLPYPVSFAESPDSVNGFVWAMQRECFIQYIRSSAGFPAESVRDLERWAFLTALDRHWSTHLDHLEEVKQAAGLSSYAGKDPLETYRQEAAKLYEQMLTDVREDTVRILMAELARWQREKSAHKKKTPVTATGISRNGKPGVHTETRNLFGTQSAIIERKAIPGINPGA